MLPHSGSSLARSRRGPATFFLFLLLALLVQGTLVQTHLHFAEQGFAPVAAASHGVSQDAQPDGSASWAHCRLCQEAAMAGAYVLPPATVLPPLSIAPLGITAAAMAEFGLLAPAQGWQSRAPPQ
jgi:hypothetical protein